MKTGKGSIQGHCDPKFHAVRDELEKNLQERDELGASVCVSIGGETVVDLWGGKVRADAPDPWEKDTISVVWSCTKGAAALCMHILASRGQLDLDAPVVKYWPELGAAGKENIPVRMLLNHQSGVAVLPTPVPAGGFADPTLMASMLAAQAPLWAPGTRHGYHALMFAWLLGEMVRRVSGRTIGTFFREEVAGPLGLDFWIGLPEEHEARVAPVIMPAPDMESPFFKALMSDPTSIQALVYNDGGLTAQVNERAAHAAEVASAMGITNARGLVGMYAPLACGGKLRAYRS
ncbi:MAG: serine hydrolase domain-containing protein [Polyangiaceae bacterium]